MSKEILTSKNKLSEKYLKLGKTRVSFHECQKNLMFLSKMLKFSEIFLIYLTIFL